MSSMSSMLTGRVKFITHNGAELLHLDFKGCGPSDIMEVIKESKPVIASRPEKSVLTLTDMSDIRFDEAVTNALKEFTAHNKPYVRAGAVVGVTGLKRIIFEAVIRFSKRKLSTFTTLDEAKEWLSKQ